MLSVAKELRAEQGVFYHSGIHDECHEICIENPCHTLHLQFCGIKPVHQIFRKRPGEKPREK